MNSTKEEFDVKCVKENRVETLRQFALLVGSTHQYLVAQTRQIAVVLSHYPVNHIFVPAFAHRWPVQTLLNSVV